MLARIKHRCLGIVRLYFPLIDQATLPPRFLLDVLSRAHCQAPKPDALMITKNRVSNKWLGEMLDDGEE